MKKHIQIMETFLFRKAWNDIFQAQTDGNAGKLIKAICAHTEGEDVTLEDKTLNGILKTITKEIDLSAYKYLLRAGYLDEYGRPDPVRQAAGTAGDRKKGSGADDTKTETARN